MWFRSFNSELTIEEESDFSEWSTPGKSFNEPEAADDASSSCNLV